MVVSALAADTGGLDASESVRVEFEVEAAQEWCAVKEVEGGFTHLEEEEFRTH